MYERNGNLYRAVLVRLAAQAQKGNPYLFVLGWFETIWANFTSEIKFKLR